MSQELLDGAMRLNASGGGTCVFDAPWPGADFNPAIDWPPGPLDLVGIYDGDCQLHHKDSMRELYASRDEWRIQISPHASRKHAARRMYHLIWSTL